MNVGEATGNQAPSAIVNQGSYSKTCVVVGVAIGSLAFSAGLLSILASKGVPLGVFNTLGNLNQIYAIGLMTFGGLTLLGTAVSRLRKPAHHAQPNEGDVDKDAGASERIKTSKKVAVPSSSAMTTTHQLPSREHISVSEKFPKSDQEVVIKEVALLRQILPDLFTLSENMVIYFSNSFHPIRSYVTAFRKIDGVINAFIGDSLDSGITTILPDRFVEKPYMLWQSPNSIGDINIEKIIENHTERNELSCTVCTLKNFTWICTTLYVPGTSQLSGYFEVFSNEDPSLEERRNQYKDAYTNFEEKVELKN